MEEIKRLNYDSGLMQELLKSVKEKNSRYNATVKKRGIKIWEIVSFGKESLLFIKKSGSIIQISIICYFLQY